MLHRMIASATVILLLLPTVAFAEPPERDTEYEEDVILLLGPFQEEELIEQDGVDAAAQSEASGAGAEGSVNPADP